MQAFAPRADKVPSSCAHLQPSPTELAYVCQNVLISNPSEAKIVKLDLDVASVTGATWLTEFAVREAPPADMHAASEFCFTIMDD